MNLKTQYRVQREAGPMADLVRIDMRIVSDVSDAVLDRTETFPVWPDRADLAVDEIRAQIERTHEQWSADLAADRPVPSATQRIEIYRDVAEEICNRS